MSVWDDFVFLPARIKKMQAGAQFLLDTITQILNHGLIKVSNWEQDYWQNISRRLIDFQLPSIARKIRYISEHITSEGQENIVRFELRWLILFANKMLDFSALEKADQFEVWQYAGAQIKKELVLTSPATRDEWQVKDIQYSTEDRLQMRKIWFLGAHTKRWACMLDYTFGNAPFDKKYYLAKNYSIEMHFYPGTFNCRAIAGKHFSGLFPTDHVETSCDTIKKLLQSLIQLLSLNPLLAEYPFTMHNTFILYQENKIYLRDSQGMVLPINPIDDMAIRLFATLGARPGAFRILWQKDNWRLIN